MNTYQQSTKSVLGPLYHVADGWLRVPATAVGSAQVCSISLSHLSTGVSPGFSHAARVCADLHSGED